MNAIKFPFQFDAPLIYKELQAIADSFNPINSVRIKKDHLSGIHLITPTFGGQKDEKGYTFQSTPALDRSPHLQAVLNTFQSNKFIFRVHNLKAKGKINLHRDADRGLDHNIVRVHVPITTNEEVYFYVNGERIQMQNGECWFADITQFHEVENRSETDRLQLMIDCDLNDWWKTILKEGGMNLDRISHWTKHSLDELQSMKAQLSQMGTDLNQEILEKIDLEIALKSQN